jgi:hypothetical protein
MFAEKLERLPVLAVRRVLILRTAPMTQVQWAVAQLKSAYPDAEFWILGKQLDHNLFANMHKFEITRPWLNSRSYRPFRHEAARASFDLAVVCLNSDSCAGYEQVGRVMAQSPAREKLVAGYTPEWYRWKHDLFHEGTWLVRWFAAVLEFALLPVVFLIVAAMPSGNKYMPAGQGRTAPGYDR